ncbi:CaiB/BaiF CoA transferase family protein [Rhodococcus sp. 3Y1]
MASLNRNKRSIALDLRLESDRETFLRLVETADAVVEGFRPQVLAGMGLGYDVLRKANPRIVLCSITGYGQSGPYADKPGHELNFLGLSGFFAVPGCTDGVVTRPGIRAGDLVGSMYAALSISVALASVDKHGRGQHIDISLAEAATAWCAPFALMIRDIENPTDSPTVQGDNDIFETSDGCLLSLATFEDKFWIEFRTAFSAEFPALNTLRYDDRWTRTQHKAELRELLVTTFGTHIRVVGKIVDCDQCPVGAGVHRRRTTDERSPCRRSKPVQRGRDRKRRKLAPDDSRRSSAWD